MMADNPPKPLVSELSDEDIAYAGQRLAEFFKDDPAKITAWWLTPNPMFGLISPANLVAIGRGHKVIEFIEAAERGDLP
jgi:hypothetical protein